MIELRGKYNTAKVYTDLIEDVAISQIIDMLNQPFAAGSSVAIMPDVHAGAGCTIGTTMTITDKVVPNLVGVDIGCGVSMVPVLEQGELDTDELRMLDEVINAYIPSGFTVRDNDWFYSSEHPRLSGKPKRGTAFLDEHGFSAHDLDNLHCRNSVNIDRAVNSLGTLGGGNHYIECDRREDGTIYLAVHSGSRSLGTGVAKYYQNLAVKECKSTAAQLIDKSGIAALREKYRDNPQMIEEKIRGLRASSHNNTPDALCWLDKTKGQGHSFYDYLNDMKIVQKYAAVNRSSIIREISEKMGWRIGKEICTIHNYIDTENMILRKGAVSAAKDEMLVIPMNMRDGVLICRGKGNPEWNYSAPHGAGRLMSRSAAKEAVNIEDFKKTMANVYTTSVCEGTLDESPFAYKPMETIIDAIGETVEIVSIAKPVYNFKASEPERRKNHKNQTENNRQITLDR